MERDPLLPAPRRGAYDRSLSRAERDSRQRERILLAASDVLRDGPLTVSRVVARAGVGRSTFYEFFDSPSHLLDQLTQRAVKALAASLDAALADARTPLEGVRAIARAWLQDLSARPSDSLTALKHRAPSDLLSPAGAALRDALSRAGPAALTLQAGWLSAADDSRLLAAAAAVEAVTRRHLSGPQVNEPLETLTEILSRLTL